MAIKKKVVSPRQKMINLMYVVLMAMLAMNVSSEVLQGFTIVQDSLTRTAMQTAKENEELFSNITMQYDKNPEKTEQWYNKAQMVRKQSQALCDLIENLKKDIVTVADGKDADITDIKNKENLDAAATVLLAPTTDKGSRLVNAIDEYRRLAMTLITDSTRKTVAAQNLSTKAPKNGENKNWLQYHFEDMPVAAAVTMLTKLQNDIRYTEGEILHLLADNIDAKDLRVNALTAFVIPESRTVIRGSAFKANIVMAAVDTTQQPEIFINNKRLNLNGGFYQTTCTQTGTFSLRGYMTASGKDGQQYRRDFEQSYQVIEPTATVSADLTNVLYAGYDNPMSISVPGIPLSQVTATMTGGTLTKNGDGHYIAKPTKDSRQAVITIFADNNGRQQQMAQHTFRIRPLPEPTAYMTVTEGGNSRRYKGGPLPRTLLTSVDHLSAAVDDGILDIPFKVLSFETVFFDSMGNAVTLASDGNSFTERQKTTIQAFARNRRFYLSTITAIGPDGIKRTLRYPMEIIIK